MLGSLEFYILEKDPEGGGGAGQGLAINIGALLKVLVMLVSTFGALQDI